jgi:hypothetical protein
VRFLTTNVNEEKAANTKLNTLALRKGVNSKAAWRMDRQVKNSGPARRVQGANGAQAMEKEALILRARAELAKLAALYASDEDERVQYEGRARAYEAQARELEDSLSGWRL